MERFVYLQSCTNRTEALMLKSLLDTYNIETKIESDDCGGIYPFLGQVKLLVHEKQKELAIEYLEQPVQILDAD